MGQGTTQGMKVLISSASIGFAEMLADLLRLRPEVESVDVPRNVEETLVALEAEEFSVHLVGGASLEYVRRSRDDAINSHRTFSASGELVLMMNEPEPFRVLLAREWGFSRVIDMRLPLESIVDRILAQPDTETWTEDLIDNFQVGESAAAPTLSEICRDKVDMSIVEGIVEGLSDPEIAARINYAVQSVRNRVSRILAASECRNRTHFAVQMMRVRNVRRTGT